MTAKLFTAPMCQGVGQSNKDHMNKDLRIVFTSCKTENTLLAIRSFSNLSKAEILLSNGSG